eukprot:TRINITY_DN94769_c0_g1_i1.p1 TRINITY_DN94769_c0_g1~~TRINITY_DN94769_c0_g1_i1.p1  ORF type:complete len:270 (+),score=65.56 TRINITY_DN94769_c0_g1_i1:63-872(+)
MGASFSALQPPRTSSLAPVLLGASVLSLLLWRGPLRRSTSLEGDAGHLQASSSSSAPDNGTEAVKASAALGSKEAQTTLQVQALVRAASDGQLEEVQRLLHSQDADVASLLGKHAELPASGWTGITALGAAALRGHEEVLQCLLQARADPEAKCQNATSWDGAFTLTQRDTALCIAAKQGHSSCVQRLLSTRADPNTECDSEFLEGSVEWGDEDDGAETTRYSALEVAEQAGHQDVAELIRRAGGVRTVQAASRPTSRKMISTGSRMGA